MNTQKKAMSEQEELEKVIRNYFDRYCNYGCDDSSVVDECIQYLKSRDQKIREEERAKVKKIASLSTVRDGFYGTIVSSTKWQ